MEERLATSAGLKFAAISSGKFRRMHGASRWQKLLDVSTLVPNVIDLFRVAKGILQSLIILRRFHPDAVFAKSGFVGLPVGVAAHLSGIPYIIHESDLEPGLANRVMGRWAEAIAVGFPVDNYKHWQTPGEKVFTGNPVRPDRLTAHRLEGIKFFGFNEKDPVVLVTGGSGGASSLNQAVLECLPEVLKIAQVIHLTGERDIDHVRFELRNSGILQNPRYVAKPFLVSEMRLALAAADIVVARAGANNIAEFAALTKPAILVPNEGMAGHQVANARLLGRADAARIIYDSKLTKRVLLAEISRLVENPAEAERLSHNIQRFAKSDAAKLLAELILATIPQSEPREAD
jgi:UDP-N-acetylglucosamine--N-acetylmuramyl-(pentapeptide) pyrophosphoryl-undecaprenol N-acetylglucosamine transferase